MATNDQGEGKLYLCDDKIQIQGLGKATTYL